jgi:hypothetical protein
MSTFTLVHVVVSLIGILSAIAVLAWIAKGETPRWLERRLPDHDRADDCGCHQVSARGPRRCELKFP